MTKEQMKGYCILALMVHGMKGPEIFDVTDESQKQALDKVSDVVLANTTIFKKTLSSAFLI